MMPWIKSSTVSGKENIIFYNLCHFYATNMNVHTLCNTLSLQTPLYTPTLERWLQKCCCRGPTVSYFKCQPLWNHNRKRYCAPWLLSPGKRRTNEITVEILSCMRRRKRRRVTETQVEHEGMDGYWLDVKCMWKCFLIRVRLKGVVNRHSFKISE